MWQLFDNDGTSSNVQWWGGFWYDVRVCTEAVYDIGTLCAFHQGDVTDGTIITDKWKWKIHNQYDIKEIHTPT
jgi:hypothetical protein